MAKPPPPEPQKTKPERPRRTISPRPREPPIGRLQVRPMLSLNRLGPRRPSSPWPLESNRAPASPTGSSFPKQLLSTSSSTALRESGYCSWRASAQVRETARPGREVQHPTCTRLHFGCTPLAQRCTPNGRLRTDDVGFRVRTVRANERRHEARAST